MTATTVATIAPNRSLLLTLKGHTNFVEALTVLQYGDIASDSDDKTIKIWNTTNVTLKGTLNGQTSWVRALTV